MNAIILRAIALALGLLPALAAAQTPNFPQTLPANTVVGKLGIGPGPSEAISFLQLLKSLQNVPSYLAPGVGAVPRTLNSKLGDFVNAADFGVVADGTDQASKIQAAIDAVAARSNGGSIVFNCGTYRVGTTINVPRGVSLIGQCQANQNFSETDNVSSTVIQWIGFATAGPVVKLLNRWHGELSNLQIDGNFWAQVGIWDIGSQSSVFRNVTISRIAAGNDLGVNAGFYLTTIGATYQGGTQYPGASFNYFDSITIRDLGAGATGMKWVGTRSGACNSFVTATTMINSYISSSPGGIALDIDACSDTNTFYGTTLTTSGSAGIALSLNRLCDVVGGMGHNFYGGAIDSSDGQGTAVKSCNMLDFTYINGVYVGGGTVDYTDVDGKGYVVFTNSTNSPRLSQVPSSNDTTTNTTMYPLLSPNAHGVGPLSVPIGYDLPKTSDSKLKFNPSTGKFESTSFYGKFQSANDTSTNATMYPLFMASSGSPTDDYLKTSSSKFTFNPSTGALGATTFSGAWGGASALTKTDDTNVTLTLGGTPATALLQPTSITAGWTGQLSRARGGTQTTTGAFLKIATQTFTANGTYTPTTGMLYAKITCTGGGAAGGGVSNGSGVSRGGGGGGGGGTSIAIASAATIGASQAVTIGPGGTGASNANGGDGTDTSVGSLCIAKKGSGGKVNDGSTGFGDPGAGGVAGTGSFTYGGQTGSSGINSSITSINFPGGDGGESMQGYGARGSPAAGTATAGNNATQCGGAGSGANVLNSATSAAGGNGFRGCVIIEEYLNQ